jgi:hypothetical protein
VTKPPSHISDKHVDINAPHEMVPCEVCLKEVPVALAHTFDAPDYVLYFCGLECLGKWEAQNGIGQPKPGQSGQPSEKPRKR